MKELHIKIPDYLTVGQWQAIHSLEGDSELGKTVNLISTLTEYTPQEIREWPIHVITDVSHQLVGLGEQVSEFHPLVQFNDKMYGFASLKNSTLGEFIDLELLLREPQKNLALIAAMLYRPVKDHRFDSFSFMRKYGINAVNNKVTDVFNYYTVQKYDYKQALKQSDIMKDFPLQFILGAMAFILATGSLYLNDIQSSEDSQTVKIAKRLRQEEILEVLSQSIGDGLVRFTASRKLIYSHLPETNR